MGRGMGKNDARSGGPQSREDRLKSALKANLARRKAQARARQDETPATPDATGTETGEQE